MGQIGCEGVLKSGRESENELRSPDKGHKPNITAKLSKELDRYRRGEARYNAETLQYKSASTKAANRALG